MLPYVSVAEFKQAPTGVDISKLDVSNIGTSAAQDAALMLILRRASAWVDSICKQSLGAKQRTETKEVHIGRDGRITVHPDNVPIRSIASASYKLFPTYTFTSIDSTQVQTLESWFSIYGLTNGYYTPNLIFRDPSFGYLSPYRLQTLSDLPVTLQYTYIYGYMNTALNGAVSVGATTVTVDDATGVFVGAEFTIYDADKTENCVVSAVVGNVITLASPLVFAHNDKTSVSAIPDDIKQATLLLAGVLIRERGSYAVTMNGTAVTGVNSDTVKSSDVDVAKELLLPYRRMVAS